MHEKQRKKRQMLKVKKAIYIQYTFKSGEECGHQRIGAFQDNKDTLKSVFKGGKSEEHRAS